MVSMNDIAESLQLSRTTVSNILNNKVEAGRYRPETVALVKETAQRMGYVPNNIARSLITGKTMTIAILVPDLANTYYVDIIKQVERECSKNGYQLYIFTSEESTSKENSIIQFLMRQRVDGLLIAPVSYSDSLRLDNIPFEVVCFDRTVSDNSFVSITIDNYTAAYQLCRNHIILGERLNIFMGSSPDDITVRDRLRGFTAALAESNQFMNETFYHILDDEDSLHILDGYLTRHGPPKPCSVFLSSTYYSIGVMKAFHKHGIKDFQLIGFEKVYWEPLIPVEIHYVDQPVKKIANKALEVLMKKIRGEMPFSIELKL